LPIAFAGLITVAGTHGRCQEELTVASAVEINAQCRALATALSLDLGSLPALDPSGDSLNKWHAEQEPSRGPGALPWQSDPDAAFYVALFGSVAAYSLEHKAAVGYSC